MANPEDYELFHYGVKGMKWGRRKAEGTSAVSRLSPDATDDAKRAARSSDTAKTKGLQALSNNDLQHLVNRQNLEQQYARLNPKPTPKAKQIVDGVIKSARTAQDLYNIYNSPVVKQARNEFAKARG